MRPRLEIDRLDVALFALVSVATFLALMLTMQLGIPRDESFYYHAGVQYVGWFNELWDNLLAGNLRASFTQSSIDRHMSYNPEHPALMKMLFGLSWQTFSQKLGWTSELVALRIPAVVFASALSGFVYLLGSRVAGRAAGVLAVVLLFLQPRFFWNAHIACFDIPIVACWVAVVYGYWRSLEDARWGIFTGIAWGIALSVKLNAFFLPGVLGLHWLIVAVLDRRAGRRVRFPWVFAWMAVLGTVLFFALWPRHWFETVPRVQWYLNFHLKHVHYFVNYFGDNLIQPPFPVSFPWVMTLVTVPATTLLAFAAGSATYRRHAPKHRTALGVLLAINVLFPIALISMPNTPVFGGTKHWSPAMPFLSIIAAAGVVWCGRAVGLALLGRVRGSSLALRAAAVAAVATAVVVPNIVGQVENHPFGTAYYNELIGSYRGAADAGMMRQFWGYASRQVLPLVDEHAPARGRVWTHNTTGYAWRMYQHDAMVRDDLRATAVGSSQVAIYHHQKAFIFQALELWDAYGTQVPDHVLGIDGVPFISVYVRE